jgi:hypothetical protein
MTQAVTDAGRDVADRMAEAARAWLDSLDPAQREVAVGLAAGGGRRGR